MKTLNGIPASPGIVIGKAFLYLESEIPEIPRFSIPIDLIEQEIERFRTAVAEVIDEIKAIQERAAREMTKNTADIMAAHLMMIEDMDFQDQIIIQLGETRENIEWVVHERCQSVMQKMLASPDPYFRERAVDVSDVSHRLLSRLLSINRLSLADLDHDVILVLHDLLPSEALTMNRNYVKGIVMDMGGNTSHTAILARAFNIPAVLGLSSATFWIKNGDTLALNGEAGEVIINPEKNELEQWEQLSVKYNQKQDLFLQSRNEPAETKDGCRVVLKANIEIPEEAESIFRYGAEGIGLYRSEFLYLGPGQVADEEVQLKAYNSVFSKAGNLPVTIRTVDIGGDKILPDYHGVSEKNPLLGWRAIRLSLSMRDFFKNQLRALLRSSVNGNMKIMFPMISGIEELNDALALLNEAKDECRKKNQPFAEKIEVGTMIEVPSAAMIADILAGSSDFLSIGTNDLVQYSLAVDRGNEKVSYLAQPAHPAILRFIKTTIDAAHKCGIKAAMCGEMAGDPGMTALLLGMGLDEFSMAASSIPLVKRIIREVAMEDCRKFADEILRGVSYVENNELLKAWMDEKFPKA